MRVRPFEIVAAAEGRADGLRAIRVEFEADHPLPKALTIWLDQPRA